MYLTTLDKVIIAIGFVFLGIWLFFYFKGRKHASLFDSLEESDYPFKEIYFVGYAIMETIKYKYTSKTDRKLRQEVEILYGPKYADYYIRVIYSQSVTIAFTVFVLSFAVYEISVSITNLLVMFIFAGVAFYYFFTLSSKKIKDRSDEMLRDFAEVASKLALLTNAGMILRDAWAETAYAGDTNIYKEMQKAVDDINNGMAEVDAYFQFGKRCMIPEIKKFTSTIIQSATKGSDEIVEMLQGQSSEIWEIRKQHVRKQGEEAASKLMIPMFTMFIGILVMILVPVFSNLGS